MEGNPVGHPVDTQHRVLEESPSYARASAYSNTGVI
jgi:hypothetical protein